MLVNFLKILRSVWLKISSILKVCGEERFLRCIYISFIRARLHSVNAKTENALCETDSYGGHGCNEKSAFDHFLSSSSFVKVIFELSY